MIACCYNFVFIPQNQYYLTTKNQFVSLLLFLVFATIGVAFFRNVLFFASAFTVSCIVEILHCRYVIRKQKLS